MSLVKIEKHPQGGNILDLIVVSPNMEQSSYIASVFIGESIATINELGNEVTSNSTITPSSVFIIPPPKTFKELQLS